MSVVAATLLLRVSPEPVSDGSRATLLLRVQQHTAAPPHLLLRVTPVPGVGDALIPSRADPPRQTVWPRVTHTINEVDEVFYPSDLADEDISLSLSAEGLDWSWAYADQDPTSTRAAWVAPTIGWEIDWAGVPGGKSPVGFQLDYRTTAGTVITYPLMGDGIGRRSSSDPIDDHVDRISGVGIEGRHDRLKVSIQLAPEHGLTHGALARMALLNAVDPTTNLTVIPASAVLFGAEIGTPINNPVDVDDEDAVELAREFLDQANHSLTPGVTSDLEGTFIALPKAPVSLTPRFSLSERDILAGESFAIEADADHPTCIVVESRSVDTTGAGGDVTTTLIELTFDIFAIDGAFWVQTGSGLDQTFQGTPGPAGTPFLQLKERKTTRTTLRDGCPNREEVIIERYINPVAARYQVSASTIDLQFTPISGVWVKEANAVDDDTSEAFLFRFDKFGIFSRTVKYFGGVVATDAFAGRIPGWVRDLFLPGQGDIIQQPTISPPLLRDAVGRQILELTFESEFLLPKKALKTRANQGIAWEDQTYNSGDLLSASLDGVVHLNALFYSDSQASDPSPDDVWKGTFHLVVNPNDWQGETFIPANHERWLKVSLLSREFIEGDIADRDEGGYLTREVVATQTYERHPGSEWLYGDGFEGRDETEQALPRLPFTEKKYTAAGNLSHSEFISEFRVNGVLEENNPVEGVGVEGYLPAVPVCSDQFSESNVPLRVKVCLADPDGLYVGREEVISVDWIETEAGLEEYGIRLLRELTAIGINLAIMPDARMLPLSPGTFDFQRRGFDNRTCWIETTEITRRGPDSSKRAQVVMVLVLKVPIL